MCPLCGTSCLIRRSSLLALALVIGLVVAVRPARAQEDSSAGRAADPSAAPSPADIAAALQQAGEQAKPDGEAPKRFPDFKDVVKDMTASEGLFTLYRYDPKDRNRDPERLLAKIPARMLDEDMLFATSISRGGQFTGWMWTDYLVRWQIVGRHLQLVVPDTNYVVKKGDPVSDVVQRTYNERFIASVPIVTMDGNDPVIDLGELLKSDIADISFMGGAVRPELSKWGKIKNFPDNILIDADLALTGRPGGAGMAGLFAAMAPSHGGTFVGVSYAFRRLPALGSYKPRVADDRVGYFLTARMDWTKKAEERETFERYVNRWDLQKRDPSLELSPPAKPIVFIIEKTVPIQWRRWVRQGILEWNKAFEKIGFVDAIVVQQQTDDNEFAEYDPEDARYNFFRWIVSGTAFAMGPSRVDPRTGQILDADIIMDDSIVRAWMTDFDVFAPATVAEFKGPGFRAFMDQHADLMPEPLRKALELDPEHQMLIAAQDKLRDNGHEVCSYARGLRQQITLVHNAIISTATGKKIPERFIGEVIQHVVSHEVGHTLGLRHNFKASSWLSMNDIRERRRNTDEATTASVMDYNPILFFADDELDSVRHFASPTIGPYDYWAIEYGYRVADKMEPEDKLLATIAARSPEKGLAYATDEDTMWVYSPDPLVNRFDMSADAVDWARSRIELCDKLLSGLPEWSLRKGEPRYYMTRAFNTIWFERASNFEYVGRFVGGQFFNRDHHGEEGARPAFELVDAQTQRKALKLLNETIFNDAFFRLDAGLLNSLSPSRWWHWGTEPEMRVDYPIHERIAMLQLFIMIDITAPPVLQRVYDAELKSTEPDRFTAAELITTLRDQVWSALDQPLSGEFTNAQPYISSIARGLQREYLRIMLAAVGSPPGGAMSADLHGMLCFALRELSDRIDAVLKRADGAPAALAGGAEAARGGTADLRGAPAERGAAKSKLDFASRAHLVECKSRIDRALNAQFAAR